jgi:hypothetical protein
MECSDCTNYENQPRRHRHFLEFTTFHALREHLMSSGIENDVQRMVTDWWSSTRVLYSNYADDRSGRATSVVNSWKSAQHNASRNHYVVRNRPIPSDASSSSSQQDERIRRESQKMIAGLLNNALKMADIEAICDNLADEMPEISGYWKSFKLQLRGDDMEAETDDMEEYDDETPIKSDSAKRTCLRCGGIVVNDRDGRVCVSCGHRNCSIML